MKREIEDVYTKHATNEIGRKEREWESLYDGGDEGGNKELEPIL